MAVAGYYTPTHVLFGKGAEEEVGRELKKEGATKVLVHYGSERIRKTGLLDKVISLIKAEEIEVFTLGGVVPNPRVSLVRKGVEMVKEHGIDFILAIGGGSVIDSSKAIAYGGVYDGDVWDFYSQKAVPKASMKTGCILTMAAAGSEMSDSSVITNDEGGLKRGCNTDYCRLRFALCNPEFTYSLPAYQAGAAIVDIMMHTMERYFVKGETLSFTDNMATALLRTVVQWGPVALKEPENYEARANIMWASSISHNGFTAFGNCARGDWACHQMEHELSGMFDVAHGAGLSAIWASWGRYVYKEEPSRFVSFGRDVFGLAPTGDDDADALRAIVATEEFFRSLGMPVRISDFGISLTEEQLEELSVKATFFGKRTLGQFMKLSHDEIKDIYRAAK